MVDELINHSMAGLIWITGYSGAGKTTTANSVTKILRDDGFPVIMLDGDELRAILGEHFGHEIDERRKLALVYGRLCKKIADSGMTVVIATIAMFEAVRKENRASNQNYLEVYLDVPLDIRSERDPKGLYRAAARRSEVGGAGMEVPENPDLVIPNYGDMTPHLSAGLIVQRYKKLLGDRDRDDESLVVNARAEYWDSYYKKRSAPIVPSSFALFCDENWISLRSHVLEFGCGNGRDSFYLARRHRVTAVDESGVVVRANQARAHQEGMVALEFLQGEFGSDLPGLPDRVDAVYSRFVMHAMPEDAEDRCLHSAWGMLESGGRLLLEFRTIQDPLMKRGEKLSAHERKTDHYRRFIDFSAFKRKLETIGFQIDFSVERQGLAVHGTDDPVVGRIVATRP